MKINLLEKKTHAEFLEDLSNVYNDLRLFHLVTLYMHDVII